MTDTLLCRELIAPVANMLAAAWAAGGAAVEPRLGIVVSEVGARPVATGELVPGSGAGGGDEGREQGDGVAPGPGGGDLCAAVDAGPGTRSRRVDRAAVRPGRRGGPAGLGCQ